MRIIPLSSLHPFTHLLHSSSRLTALLRNANLKKVAAGMDESRVLVFALACRFQFVKEAKAASRASLMSSIKLHHSKNAEEILEQAGFKIKDYMALHALRDRRITQMQEYLDGEGFEGVRLLATLPCHIETNLCRRTPPTSHALLALNHCKTQPGLSSKRAS